MGLVSKGINLCLEMDQIQRNEKPHILKQYSFTQKLININPLTHVGFTKHVTSKYEANILLFNIH